MRWLPWTFALLAAPCLWSGDAAWTRIKSSNFELYTSAGENRGREAVLYFERVQGVFANILKGRDLTPLPVRVVLFRSKKEYEPYRPTESAAAYYLSSRDRDYIVMSGGGTEDYPIALHEYTHLLIRHGKQKVPLWLNEGLAELYSSLQPQAKRVMIGSLLPGRMATFDREKWIPLANLVEVEHDSPEYTEKKRAAMFYAESWALAHMLVLQDNYRQELPRLVKALDQGKTAAESFQAVYGLTLEQLDKVLRRYVRGDRFNAGFFDTRFDKVRDALEVTALTSYEGDLILSDLLLGLNRQKEAARMYESLAQQQPNRPEAAQGLAYLALRRGDHEAALKHFARAAMSGSDNPQLYRDYAGALEVTGRRGRELRQVLEKALSLDPGSVETRIRLAHHFLRDGDFAQALVHYRQVKVVSKEQAPAYMEGLFHACYRTGDKTCAQAAASQLREFAATPDEILAAEKKLKLLEQPAPSAHIAPQDDRPALRRASPAKETPPAASGGWQPRFTGTLEKLDCNAAPARLIVTVDGKPVEFVMDNAVAVQLRGFGADSVEFDCGPLKPARVSIEFLLDEKSQPPARLVRSIELVKLP
jgi:tetratricopeptide (TPR) repeat protein